MRLQDLDALVEQIGTSKRSGNRSARDRHNVRWLLIFRMIIRKRLQEDLELVHIGKLQRQSMTRLTRLRQQLEEALKRGLECGDGEPFYRRRRHVRSVYRPRRHWRDGAPVGPVGSTGHNVLTDVATDLALDALYVIVATDIADGVALSSPLKHRHGARRTTPR